ncbi:MAG: glycosyltransferase family 4 protein, partial [Pseudomonadota bacterium]|nr:glycosyltransferase family 4 protein [Pseudomonadota bacterium]MEC7910978.1 glycosyltransferase family 4 protein [Pseudomonadota bacterium]
RVIRIRVMSREYGMIGRLLAEISYSQKINKALKNLLKKNNELSFDAIICLSPSIFYGSAIKWLKKKFKAKAYLVCRDIFPKWAIDSGLLKKGLLYRYFKYIEKKLYNSVDIVGIESKADMGYFLNTHTQSKFEVLNNWGSPQSKPLKNQKKILNPDKVNILYGGNMAEAQNLFSLIEIIDESILDGRAILTLIGSGHQLESIKKAVKNKRTKSIKILPEVDSKTYLSILGEADIGLVSLNKDLKSNNYPLKMMGYLQMSKPILASVNDENEIIELINKNNIGFVSIAGDESSFNKNLNTLIENDDLRRQQGNNSLKLFNDRFTVKKAVDQIISHF